MTTKRELSFSYDNYEQTVQLVVVLRFLFKTFNSEMIGVGRKMNSSEQEESLTPDITAEFNNFGLINEIKKSICEKHLTKEVLQLKKYDTIVGEWKANKNLDYDIFLFVHTREFQKLIKFLEESKMDSTYKKFSFKVEDNINNISFAHNLAIFRWMRVEETDQYYQIIFDVGNVSDQPVSQNFKNTEQKVFMYQIIDLLSTFKFTDDKPPMVYLLPILWEKIFSTFFVVDEYKEVHLKGKNIIEKELTLEQVFNLIDETFIALDSDTGKKQIIKSWIKEAIDILDSLDLCKWIDKAKFNLKYKRIDNIKDFFISKLSDDEEPTDDSQKSLGSFIQS